VLGWNPVELGQGQLQLAMVQRLDGLHGAFAEGLAADDQGAVVVLHGSGENLRGRSRQAVDQQRHRAFVEGARVFVFQDVDAAIALRTSTVGPLSMNRLVSSVASCRSRRRCCAGR
jgi:hypothetical protein